VLICSSEGKHLKTIALPHTQDGGPTNIEFAGKDLKTVYITDPGDNCVWKMMSDVPGAKLFESP
jgi:sugar lactone lactonase YvrE